MFCSLYSQLFSLTLIFTHILSKFIKTISLKLARNCMKFFCLIESANFKIKNFYNKDPDCFSLGVDYKSMPKILT